MVSHPKLYTTHPNVLPPHNFSCAQACKDREMLMLQMALVWTKYSRRLGITITFTSGIVIQDVQGVYALPVISWRPPAYSLLLQKLQMYQVNESIIHWIKSFLCYRMQWVKLNGYFFRLGWDKEWIATGYYFGSHFIHNLHKLFLPSLCNQFAKTFLFADNACLYEHVISEEDREFLQWG